MADETRIDTSLPREEMAQRAIDDPNTFDELIEALSGENRRLRQYASKVLGEVSKLQPELLVPCIEQLADALDRPEAQTRWQMLDVLSLMTAYDIDACEAAFDGAQAGLYDEESDFLHLASFTFLCKYGAHDKKRSEKVWPFLDEAIQCYHGDLSFQDMLTSLIEFSQGKLSSSVKKALAERVRFDAENGKGPLGRRMTQVLENVSK